MVFPFFDFDMKVFKFRYRVLTALYFLLMWSQQVHSNEPNVSGESLLEVTSGQPFSSVEFLKSVQQADILVLGEIHDNPRHHVLRATLLSDPSMAGRQVVAEPLSAGLQVDNSQALLAGLERAGFDAAAWGWPLHEPVFSAARSNGLPIHGGNITPSQTRDIFKSKGHSLPNEIQALLERASLNGDELKQLRQEIDEGHCGALPATMFDAMVAVQRARDATMSEQILQHLPAVLIAGNGHAWKHLGVPQIIRHNRPELRLVSVLLLEHAPFATTSEQSAWAQGFQGIADFVWVTPAQPRTDPCLSLVKK